MSLSTQTLNPVNEPGLLYPTVLGIRPKRRHYKCPRCGSTNRSSIISVLLKTDASEKTYGMICRWENYRWFVSSKLILNDILEEQIERISKFTKKTGKEFGALIVRSNQGIRLEMTQIGEDYSVSMSSTRKMTKGEEILGTWHSHPVSDGPSFFDVGTFLRDKWEVISCVSGASGNLTVMVKTKDTVPIKSESNIHKWAEENRNNNTPLIKLAEKHKFLVYQGKSGNLRFLGGKGRNTTLESLVKKIKGVKRV